MKPPRFLWTALAGAIIAVGVPVSRSAISSNTVPVGSTNAAASSDPGTSVVLDAKAMARRIAERNIFDPDRQPRVRGESRPVTRPKPVVPADAPELGLVGVMSFPRGTFAFFDGNAPEFRKTLQADAVVAGHVLGAITPHSVTLSESNRPPIQLRVGQRLRKDTEGVWQRVDGGGGDGFTRSGGGSGASSGGSGAGASTATATTSEDPPGSDEILKRLLKKREQEMK